MMRAEPAGVAAENASAVLPSKVAANAAGVCQPIPLCGRKKGDDAVGCW
jgi:hypothetical protein